jgi:tetratricopeptide (TPR) repeat protein
MARVEKTVFISYRRTNAPWALAISQNLTHSGYDGCFDFTGLASGDFETVILENIRAHAHFLVLLTPSALERCGEPGDWLRREIEAALDFKRNIVPLMLEGFDFDTPSIATQLTGKLALLRRYNAMTVSVEYFDPAMEKLRTSFLNVALEAVVQPASPSAIRAAVQAKTAAALAPAVADDELTAQQWFERGRDAHFEADLANALQNYDQALRLKPDFLEALNNRSVVRHNLGDLDGALADCDEAIRLNPDAALAYFNRGRTLSAKRDAVGALRDLSEGIRLKPDDAEAFNERGIVRRAAGDLAGAMADYTQALRLEPDLTKALNNRGNVRKTQGDLDGAIADYAEAIRLQPANPIYFYSRGVALAAKADPNAALADLNEAIRLKPDYDKALATRDQLLRLISGRSKS